MNLRALLRRALKSVLPTFLLRQVKAVYYANAYEAFDETREPDLVIVRRLVKTGDRVVDVGANVGLYTVTLSRLVGNSGKVYSYEPVPDTYNTLTSVVKKLSLRNVETRGCALSDSVGQGSMEVPLYEEGGENLYQARLVSVNATRHRTCSVEMCTLDSLIGTTDTDRIDFMKIDVEGHELQVLQGGRRMLEQFRPSLLIEVSGNPDERKSSAFALFEELSKLGYIPYWFDGKQLRMRKMGDISINYFFLMSEHVKVFRECQNEAPFGMI